jgi:hypothetical protein
VYVWGHTRRARVKEGDKGNNIWQMDFINYMKQNLKTSFNFFK